MPFSMHSAPVWCTILACLKRRLFAARMAPQVRSMAKRQRLSANRMFMNLSKKVLKQNNKRKSRSSNSPNAFEPRRIRRKSSGLAKNSDRWFSASNAQNRTVGRVSLGVAAAPDRANARQKHHPGRSQSTQTVDRIRSRGTRRRLVQGFWIIQIVRRRTISEDFPAARSTRSWNKAVESGSIAPFSLQPKES